MSDCNGVTEYEYNIPNMGQDDEQNVEDCNNFMPWLAGFAQEFNGVFPKICAAAAAGGMYLFKGEWGAAGVPTTFNAGWVVLKDGAYYASNIDNNTDEPPSSNWTKVFVRKGDPNERFKVADAVMDDEAVNLAQLNRQKPFTNYELINETANREEGVVYTNSTGEPIFCMIVTKWLASATVRIGLKIDGVLAAANTDNPGSSYAAASSILAIIPPNSEYELYGCCNIDKFYEYKKV